MKKKNNHSAPAASRKQNSPPGLLCLFCFRFAPPCRFRLSKAVFVAFGRRFSVALRTANRPKATNALIIHVREIQGYE